MGLKKIKTTKLIPISQPKRACLISWPFFCCPKKAQHRIKCKYHGTKKESFKDNKIGNFSDSQRRKKPLLLISFFYITWTISFNLCKETLFCLREAMSG